jgi:hypothetical protein
MYSGTLPPVSNKATWDDTVQCIDDETNAPFDISTATEIVVEVADCGRSVLKATLSGGTVLLGGTGIFSFTFTPSQMCALCAKTYDFNCFVTMAGETVQVVAAQLPVIDGRNR